MGGWHQDTCGAERWEGEGQQGQLPRNGDGTKRCWQSHKGCLALAPVQWDDSPWYPRGSWQRAVGEPNAPGPGNRPSVKITIEISLSLITKVQKGRKPSPAPRPGLCFCSPAPAHPHAHPALRTGRRGRARSPGSATSPSPEQAPAVPATPGRQRGARRQPRARRKAPGSGWCGLLAPQPEGRGGQGRF